VLRGRALSGLSADMRWSFTAELFRWDAEGPSWRFIRVPGDLADDIRMVAVELVLADPGLLVPRFGRPRALPYT
jgi:hypothetical protein